MATAGPPHRAGSGSGFGRSNQSISGIGGDKAPPEAGNKLRRAEGERLISRLMARPPRSGRAAPSRCGGASEEFATNGAKRAGSPHERQKPKMSGCHRKLGELPEHSYIPVYGRNVAGSWAPRELSPTATRRSEPPRVPKVHENWEELSQEFRPSGPTIAGGNRGNGDLNWYVFEEANASKRGETAASVLVP